jgi:hypothetical protein
VAFERQELEIRTEWSSRRYTTDPPRFTPYDVWTLEVEFRSTAPFRIAQVLRFGERNREWATGYDNAAAISRTLDLRIAPVEPPAGDEFSLQFGPLQPIVQEAALASPQGAIFIEPVDGAVTGEVITLMTLTGHRLSFGVIAFSENDSQERRRGRWRVHPDRLADLPAGLDGLVSGRQRGISEVSG